MSHPLWGCRRVLRERLSRRLHRRVVVGGHSRPRCHIEPRPLSPLRPSREVSWSGAGYNCGLPASHRRGRHAAESRRQVSRSSPGLQAPPPTPLLPARRRPTSSCRQTSPYYPLVASSRMMTMMRPLVARRASKQAEKPRMNPIQPISESIARINQSAAAQGHREPNSR